MSRQLSDLFDIQRARIAAGDMSLSDKTGVSGEMEVFLGLASSVCDVPMEVVHVRRGERDALPRSSIGRTTVRYVGKAPTVSVEPDANGNLEMTFEAPAVIEVIFNSDKPGARGRNRGSHGRKKIYVVD